MTWTRLRRSRSTPTRRSRRLFLTGAAAAGTAAVADVLAAPAASADTGDAMTLGEDNEADQPTLLTRTGDSGPGLIVGSTGIAVQASGNTGGVVGLNLGDNDGAGVQGIAAETPAAGVSGIHDAAGPGVVGFSERGSGVLALTNRGVALDARGAARFGCSGRAKVPAGRSQLTVNERHARASGLVLVTPQQHKPGVWVTGVEPRNGSFVVHLNKAAPQGGLVIGYFALRAPVLT